MIVGRRALGASAVSLAAGHLYLWDVGAAGLATDLIVGSLAVYLDGHGSGSGEQLVRPVIAEADDAAGTLAIGDEAVVVQGQDAGWQHLTFDLPPRIRAGRVPWLGLFAGTADQLARVLGVAGVGAGKRWAIPYGPTAELPAAPDLADVGLLAPVLAIGVAPWTPPDLPDGDLAALPLDVAMAALGGTSVGAVAAPVAATAGWHYLHDDPPDPATCIVRTGGPLEALVGQRVRVTAGGASVVLYVDDEEDFDPELAGEDLSLSRVAFARLAPLWTDALPVSVEVV